MITVITKCCSKCKKDKELSEFGLCRNKGYKHDRRTICRDCRKIHEYQKTMADPTKKAKMYESNKRYREKNPGKYKGVIFPSKWKSLGIHFTEEMYNDLLMKQNGKCAICGDIEVRYGQPIALSVDHDHTTNKVRGLLCGNCNRGIGLLKDDPDTLFRASIYLKTANS